MSAKMQETTNFPKRFRRVVSQPLNVPLITPKASDRAEYKPPNDPPAKVFPSLPGEPLTPEQELLLIEHLPIVRFIARRIHERLPRDVSVEDLYSAGVLGLVDAFGRFDPSKQVLLRTYAQFRIRGAILDSLRTLDWSPRELRHKGRAVELAIQRLTAQFLRSPTDVEIAQKLNIPLLAYQQLLGELKGLEIGTLRREHCPDSEEEELIYLPGRPEDDPLFRFLDGEMRHLLTMAINDLPDRERLVMPLYYYEETTMREIGIILDIVESRVSQIHASAVLHLRAQLATSTELKELQNKADGDHPERVPGVPDDLPTIRAKHKAKTTAALMAADAEKLAQLQLIGVGPPVAGNV
jgi:RNA polymerase sigma factor for flagellar operon FliA